MPPPPDRNAMLARIHELEPSISPIQGWLDRNAGGVMYQLVRAHLPAGTTVVELGSWKGRSTGWLGHAANDRGDGTRVVAVDTWAGTTTETLHSDLLKGYGPDQLYDEFRGNMARLGLADTVEPWRMTTLDAARRWDRGPVIGLLHIDAGHEYADVRADFEHWAPYVAPGGFIVFDDVPSWPGPARVVSELPSWYEFNNAGANQWCVRKRPV